MKKFLSLLAVIALLIVSTGAATAGKPEPDQFTITGYTTNDPFTDPESVIGPNGRMRLHITARGGGTTDAAYDGLCTLLAAELELADVDTCQELCLASQNQACGAAGIIDGKPLSGEFIFDEWVEFRVNPVTGQIRGQIKNDGDVTITAPDGSFVTRFNGRTDTLNVWGNFKIEKKDGTGVYEDLKGNGDYTGNAGLVFTVTFTGKLKN
jgi:hypothetical protein